MCCDECEIRAVVQNWALWRDAGSWERFATVWHPGARMIATWYQGDAVGFIDASRRGFANGVRVLHFLGGTAVDRVGRRAVAQTKMTISQRLDLDGVECDVTCTGRFYDFFEKRSDEWRIVVRQPIYEKDRIDPVHPGDAIEIDREALARFPEGYRYLGYAQSRIGLSVKCDLPGLVGPEVESLYAAGGAFLAGDAPAV